MGASDLLLSGVRPALKNSRRIMGDKKERVVQIFSLQGPERDFQDAVPEG
jgi:hypothetical protein